MLRRAGAGQHDQFHDKVHRFKTTGQACFQHDWTRFQGLESRRALSSQTSRSFPICVNAAAHILGRRACAKLSSLHLCAGRPYLSARHFRGQMTTSLGNCPRGKVRDHAERQRLLPSCGRSQRSRQGGQPGLSFSTGSGCFSLDPRGPLSAAGGLPARDCHFPLASSHVLCMQLLGA